MKTPGSLVSGALVGLIIGAAATAFLLTRPANAPQTAAESSASRPGADAAAGQRGGRPGGPPGRGGFAPAVSMIAAQPASVGRTLDVIGEGRALKSVALTSEATGIVTEVNIAPGKKVYQGDVVLRLDDEQQRIALYRARAQYPIAKENAERYADLVETEAASELEAEAAFNNFKTIEADLRAAEFAVQQRTIRAPFDGVSGLTEIEAGDYLRAGDMVTTLDDTSSIVIEFSVPQEAATSVEIGQPVTAQLASGGAPHEGRISAIDSRVNPDTRTLRLEASFENTDGRLLPGAIFAISTTNAGEPAVAIPGLALQWDRTGPYVWKRGEEGAAVRASVTILQRTDENVLVAGDISAGELVVWEGADRIRPGMPLPQAGPAPARRDRSSPGSTSSPGAFSGSE